MAVEPKTKVDQEKMGDRAAAPRRRRSDFPGLHQRGNRPDDHRRHGRAAPRNHPRPHAPRVQGRGQRRQAADRLPRNHHQAGRRRRQVHQAVRRPRSIRPRRSSRFSPTNGARASRSRTRSSAAPSRRNTFRPSRRASKKPMLNGVRRRLPVIDVNVDIVDGSLSTTWTRTKWRSRWRRFSRSRTASRRRSRSCSSRS